MLASFQIVTSGTAKIAAECEGSGRPIVFVHANVADRRIWRHQFNTLATRFQVIAYDRRGFGNTPAVDETYSQAADLITVLNQLTRSDEPAILIGCSAGGSIAIDTYLAWPSQIASLVLVAPSVGGGPAAEPVATVQQLLGATQLARKSGDLDEVNRLQAALWLDGALGFEGRVSGSVRDLFLSMNAITLSMLPLGHAAEPEPAWNRLYRVTCPTRILYGDLDIPHIQERCRKLAAILPNARCEKMNAVAHLPSLEQPVLFTDWLLTVLADFA